MKEAVTLLLLDGYDDVEWNDPKVLAVKRLKSKGKLGLPGGKVDPGETLEEAIIREVKEECNVTIPKEALVKVYACIVNGYYCTTFAIKKEHLKTIKHDELKQVEIEIEPIWVKFNTYDFVMKSEFTEYNAGLLRNLLEIIEYLKNRGRNIMTVVLQSGEWTNFIVDTFLKNNKRVFVNPKTMFTNPKDMSFGSEEDILLLENYDWCEPTVCKNCKSNYANREDSLTCPCLDEY